MKSATMGFNYGVKLKVDRRQYERWSLMNNTQAMGIRILCMALGWAFGALIFGTDAVWLWGTPSFIWCGVAGGAIGIMITSK